MQNAFNLCDHRIFETRRCVSRCGNCRGETVFVFDVAQAARIIVGSSTRDDSGIMAKLCARGNLPSLGEIAAEWSFQRSEAEDHDSNYNLPDNLLQLAVLVLCAHEFITPRVLRTGRSQRFSIVFEPSIPALIRRLYPEVESLYRHAPFTLRSIGPI